MDCIKCGEPCYGDNWHCDNCKDGINPFDDDMQDDDDIAPDVCETCGMGNYKHFIDCPENPESGLELI